MNARKWLRLTAWAALLALALLVGPAWGQAVVYVDAGASGAGDGSSWADAFTSVQAGLNAAAAGDQVWVAAGRYVENITLVDGVALYGGFAGDEDPETFDLAERDFAVNETILDGDEAGSVVTAVDLADEATRIDGFTITNGSSESGGGLYLAWSSPTIQNNTIAANMGWYGGGGLYLSNSSPTIEQNNIADNSAYAGGGLCLYNSSPTIANNAIVGNYGDYLGGGLDLSESSPTIVNNTITANRAGRHGGGLCLASSCPTIANNAITGNRAYDRGGGLYLSSSSPAIVDNRITNNSVDSSLGGGLYLAHSSPTIMNNTITGNSAFKGGGLSLYQSSPTIANNRIMDNSARLDRGGGLYLLHSSPMIANNTITGNSALSGGGGLDLAYSFPTIANTIIAFNLSGIRVSSSDLILRHNCVYGNAEYDYLDLEDPTGTDGNISEDPLFADPAYGNWHLQPDSPCVDAGDNDYVFSEFDMDGEPRIQPMGGTVDIGADESDGTIWPAGPYVIVRVSPEGDDGNDGSSWALAKRTVQASIDVTSELGGEVWVAAGTYHERITLLPYAYVYGGFAGSESALDQRDWVSSVTVLDGQQEGSVVTALGGQRASALDGFTVTNGGAERGGGLYLSFSSPTIANNTFTGNSAERYGGGLYLGLSSPMIVNNTIADNSARYGGGLHAGSCSPTIANNTIKGNSAKNHGGALSLYTSAANIVNNTIVGNTGGDEGGGLYLKSSAPAIANTIIAFNSSGICLTDGGEPILRHNCVHGNTEYDYSGLDDPTGTGGNISKDPLFADAAYGNWHIQPDSPCVDAGDNDHVVGDVDTDGEPRIQPAGGTVDIGADESDGTVWPAGPYVIVRVSTDGADDSDGSSWPLAKRSVQAGIDEAAQFGGDVWVAAGTYQERITLLPYAYLYGGFAGSESELEQRDWVANVTVLDGQQEGSVVTAGGGRGVSALDGFTVMNGSAYYGGGLHLWCSSPTIVNNTITGNRSLGSTFAGGGGGLYLDYSSATITKNIVAGNSSSSYGGGLHLSNSSATIAYNTIMDNSTEASGGGLYVFGSSPAIANNTITGNEAVSSGGGMLLHSSLAISANNTIAGNKAGAGGGLHVATSAAPATIVNTIVAFNSSGVCRAYGPSPILKHNCVYGNTEYEYSGLYDPTGADGNISEDPLFVLTPDPGPDGEWGTEDDELGDLRLSAGSPCIDAGDNAYVPEFVTTDLDGKPRYVDGSGDGVATVDMGAYEYQFRPGDLNCDGAVSVFDIDPFVLALTSAFDEPPFAGYLAAYPDCDPRLADVSGDGLVNVFDIDPFVAVLTGEGK